MFIYTICMYLLSMGEQFVVSFITDRKYSARFRFKEGGNQLQKCISGLDVFNYILLIT